MQRNDRSTSTGLCEAVMMTFFLALLPLTDASALGLSPYTSVKEISLGTGNKPIFRLDNAGDAGTGCANDVWIRFPDLAAYEGNRRIYDMVVSALMNRKQVLIETVSCDEDWPLLNRIWVKS